MSFLRKLRPLFLALLPTVALAQPGHPIKWETEPKLHTIPDSLKKHPAVFILEERRVEMQSGDANYGQYYTVHHIIRLNDDKGVEAFNTFSIPVVPGTKLYDIKARTILPGGKVMTVAREKIKKIKSEEGLPEYLLAMEGVEPGSEVEVLYTEELPGTASGKEVFQYKVPIQQAVFRMIVPEHMLYEVKGYNGFPKPKDSLMEGQRSYSVVARNIPALEEEDNARYRSALQRIDYKLSYVLRTGKDNERRQTWSEMANLLYDRYIDIGTKELRFAKSLLETIGVKPTDDEVAKIIAIEEYFKTNISISDELTDEHAADFDQITRKKLTTEKGFVRLFAACLNAAGIEYEVGMVGNRFSYDMDDSLEIWSNLSEYCFYLPKHQTYIAPAAITFRYPYLPYQMNGARGVFTKSTGSSNGTSVKKDIRTMPHMPMNTSGISLTVSVHFDPKDLVPVVSTNMSMKGYSASILRPGLLFTPKDKEQELIQELLGLSNKPSDMTEYKTENVAFSNYASGKPLVLSATTRAPRLMEKAGPKYLFKAGELIGKQSELYQETERSLPVEIDYPNEQPRSIRITIPAGYKVANPEALRSKVVCSRGGKDIAGFSSDYKMEGSELVVTLYEYYSQTTYPVSEYQCYRKVVNAAADFNKVVLVLQKI